MILGLLGAGKSENQGSALSEGWKGLLLVGSIELALFGILLGVGCFISRTTRDDLLLRARSLLMALPLGIAYSIGLRLAIGVVGFIIIAVLVITQDMSVESIGQMMQNNAPQVEKQVDVAALKRDPIYYVLCLTFISFIVAGLREELWRSASLSALARLWPRLFGGARGPYIAVALTSLIFGIGHLPMGWIAVAATTLIGIGLGIIMVAHRSIWPAVIAHGMFDATTLAMLPFVVDKVAKGG